MTAVRRRVEHVDTDASGLVHFSRYASLMETALLEHLDRIGAGLTALAGHGLDLVVAELSIRYHSPARFPDELDLLVTKVKFGVVRLRAETEVRRADGEPLATGTLTLGVVDQSTGTPTPLPEPIATLLKEHDRGAR
ncbi:MULTISPECIES: thioesterase family protein [Actinosynnema]|uniref:acyl-CoA thioesterase n=1 Tax=Actinosynnema TaxID=40566 RepID=UPI0020A4E4CE|nr:thioesterase family protein [Actinosynnema pretiosum]MCP2099801.1 acyl-CoA thioester hydrolase [Actinosynnema pretiosum]